MTDDNRAAVQRVVDWYYGNEQLPTDELKRQLHVMVKLLEELGVLPKGESE